VFRGAKEARISNMHPTRREFLTSAAQVSAAAFGVLSRPVPCRAETDSARVAAVLKQKLQTEDVVEFQLRQYLMKRVPSLPKPGSSEEWTKEQRRLRKYVLEEVLFRGWPAKWVSSPPRFEDLGILDSGKGFRMRKLRFEIVPDFWSTAILYEPEKVTGKIPATLNLNGHSPQGKAAEYKQKRCINFALRGIFALSPEWLGMGELGHPENEHWFGAHLNLVGACATGLFYLAMRRGLDYLCNHPSVDTQRVGVTGLSGGAWQTIILSALDERVAAALPISGYFAYISGLERNSDIGDIEYNPPDFRINFDYTVLTAMMAPRPTLLIYAAEDEYGMRAPLEKPYLYDDVRRFFSLYGKRDDFAWHENTDPGTHNYELDNRQQSYTFFAKHFGLPSSEKEITVDGEIKSLEELAVGLPSGNLTILGLSKRFANGTKHQPVPDGVPQRSRWAESARAKLRSIVRYRPVAIKHAWAIGSTRNKGLETLSYRFEFDNELSASGIWLKATTTPHDAPIAVVIDDDGMQNPNLAFHSLPSESPVLSNGRENSIAWRVNRGEQVLAVNLLFTGDASPDKLGAPKGLWDPSALYTQLLASVGDRPLGMQAAQLVGVAKWFQSRKKASPISVEAKGIRSQVTALVASALESTLFKQLLTRGGMRSFGYLLEKPVRYQDAPDLFCFDLYREFDIDGLATLVEPTKVTQVSVVDAT